jgi:hypothetical protein
MKRFLLVPAVFLLLAGCDFSNFRNNLSGYSGTELSYSVSNLPASVTAVSLAYNPDLTCEDITEEQMHPVLARPVDVHIEYRTDGEIPGGSCTVTLAVPEKPDALVVFNKTSADRELRPFEYNPGNGEITFSISCNALVSVLPVTCEGMEDLDEVPVATLEPGTGLGEYAVVGAASEKPFTVLTNNGNQITVALDDGYFRKSTWWDFSYLYAVSGGGTTVSGSSSGIITVDVPKSGVYSFEIRVRYRKKYKYWFFGYHYYFGSFFDKWILWRQDVLAEKYALSNTERNTLANLYAPIVIKDSGEYYNPASLEYIFNKEDPDATLASETFELTDNRLLRPTLYESLLPHRSFSFGSADQMLPYWGNRNALINIPSVAAVTRSRLRLRTNPDHPVVYYTFQERSTYDYIHYHFLYACDLKQGGTPQSPEPGSHLFDRESFVVVLNKATHQPMYSVYGGHLDNNFLYLGVETAQGVFETIVNQAVAWGNGRLRRVWASTATIPHSSEPGVMMDNDTLRAGTHPLVFIAQGSHAVYPYPGIYRYKDLVVTSLKDYAGLASHSGWNADQILMPPAAPAAALPNYELRDLNPGRITSFSANRYLAFSGYLVDVMDIVITFKNTNTKFPPYTNREENPDSYCISAQTVNWNWIPEEIRDDLNSLEEIINDYITVDDPFAPY